jgi:predicted Zn-dependent protease with MMP-like domain
MTDRPDGAPRGVRAGPGYAASVDTNGTAENSDGTADRLDDDRFEDWVAEAIDTLPAAFRDRLGSVAILIEDEPSAELLASLHVPGLYGLYQGVPRSALGADHAASPSRITIYRETIRRGFPTEAGQRAKVIETVQHEVAHHFGISDARLRELKTPANRRRGSA